MKTKFLIFLSFSLVFFACANNAQKAGTDATSDAVASEHKSTDHETDGGAIQLDHGQPWKVDDNMMEIIKKMDDEVASFSGKTYNDYQVLAMDLTEQIDALTSNCTMTGQAHDELHKWLLPYIDLVNDFAKADNPDDAHTGLMKIKTSFETFNKFFR